MAYVLRWRRRHLNDNQFVLVVSFFVGIFTACAGLLLKWLIGQIEHLLTQSFVESTANWLYLTLLSGKSKKNLGNSMTDIITHHITDEEHGKPNTNNRIYKI